MTEMIQRTTVPTVMGFGRTMKSLRTGGSVLHVKTGSMSLAQDYSVTQMNCKLMCAVIARNNLIQV